jgi:hypothetical protein
MKHSATKHPTHRGRYPVGIVAVVAIVFLTHGCGKPSHQLDTAPFKGKVTLDGQPFGSGYVVFSTTRGRMSTGSIQPDGAFEMSTYEQGDGAQVGTHPVVITPIPSDEFVLGQKPIPVPVRYTKASTSGLIAEVKSGEDNYQEFHLTTNEQKN